MFLMIVMFDEFCKVKVIFEEEKVKLVVVGMFVVDDIKFGIMIEILVVVILVD